MAQSKTICAACIFFLLVVVALVVLFVTGIFNSMPLQSIQFEGAQPEAAQFVDGEFFAGSVFSNTFSRFGFEANPASSSVNVDYVLSTGGTLGLYYDDETELLYAASNDHVSIFTGQPSSQALVVAIDPQTEDTVLNYSIPGGQMLNDLVVVDGAVYVTDTVLGVIYMMSEQDAPVVFATDVSWQTYPEYALNGIESFSTDAGSYLLTVHSSLPEPLFRVDMEGNIIEVTVYGIEEGASGFDGLRFLSDGTLAMTNNTVVYQLESSDDWVTAMVIAMDTSGPVEGFSLTTLTTGPDDSLWVVNTDLYDTSNTIFYLTRVNFIPYTRLNGTMY